MSKKLKKRKIIIAAAALALAAASTVIILGATRGSGENVTEVTAQRQNILTYYSFTGNIASHDSQYVQSKSSEPVKKFFIREGDKVNAGDLLYEVDSNSIQSIITQANTSLSTANTNLDSAKLNLERMQTLFEIGGISLSELENAKSQYTSAQNQVSQATANYQQAQKQYEDTQCRAEVAGEISKIYVKENESLVMGTSILDIVDYDNLEVKIKVDEYDLSTIKEGMNAEVYVEALGKHLTGSLSEIAREASVESGVSYFEATVVMPQDPELRIGLTAEIKIVTQKAENVVTVPIAAVIYGPGGATVQVHGKDGKPEQKSVKVGINDEKVIEIMEGLSEGDAVLISAEAADGVVQMQQPGAAVRIGPGGRPQGGDNQRGGE